MVKDPNKQIPEREVRRYRRRLSFPLRNANQTINEKTGYLLRERDPGRPWRYAEATPLVPLPGERKELYEDLLQGWRKGHIGALATLKKDELFGFPLWCLARQPVGDSPGEEGIVARSSCLLPAGAEALEVLPAMLEKGYRTFKWKVGVGNPSDEIKIAGQLFAAAPEKVKFRLDANLGWGVPELRSWGEFLRGTPVEFVEEPLPLGMDVELCEMGKTFPVPIALDERLREPGGLSQWLETPCMGYYVIKPSLAGSVSSWWLPLERRALLSRVILSSALETAVGTRQILELAKKLPGEIHHGLGVGEFFRGESPSLSFPEKPFYSGEDLLASRDAELWEAAGEE